MGSRFSSACGPRAVKMLTVVALAAACAVLLAQPPDRTRTEALARRATDRLLALQREADRLAADERTVLGDLRKLELERQMKTEELRAIGREADEVAAAIEQTTARVAALEQQERAQRPDVRARVIELYKLGHGRYLKLWLSTSELRHVGEATRIVAVLATLDRERFAAHQQTLDQVKAASAGLEARRQQVEVLRVEAERARAALAAGTSAKDALVREIDRRRDVNAQLTAELQGAQQKLQATLHALATGGVPAVPTLPLRPFRGDLEWPVSGPVVARFGQPAGVRSPSPKGIEIAVPEGEPVRAVHDGTVAFADAFAGFGNLVIVDHGGNAFSLYGQLSDMAVQRGERVDRAHVVGTAGLSPAGPAGLYFELRIDGQAVDPLQWLKKP